MITTRALSFRALAGAIVLAALAPGSARADTPGSGSAVVDPSTDVAAGATGTWRVVYTAGESFNAGTVRVTVPAGWTAPQAGDSTAAGYVTVSTSHAGGAPSLTVVGRTITVSVGALAVGETVTVAWGDDSGGAEAGARVTAPTTPRVDTLLVESDPNGSSTAPLFSGSPTLRVVPGPPFSLDVLPADTTLTAGDYADYTIVVVDAWGNPSPVSSVRQVSLFPDAGTFFLPSDTTTPVTSFVVASGADSVSLVYRDTLATSGTPHDLTMVTLDGQSPTLFGTTGASVVPAAVSASRCQVSATSPVTADGTSQSSVTVTSRDRFANVRSGDVVTLTATGNAVAIDPLAPTDASGQAVGALTDTKAETVTVSATVGGVAVVQTADVTFVAGAVSADSSRVDATTPVVADGATTSTITVTARDAHGNPVSGRAVALTVTPSGTGEVLVQPGGVTDAQGRVTGALSSPVTGPRVVRASVEGVALKDSAVVTFTAGALADFAWTTPAADTAGRFSTVTLEARDARGNRIPSYAGTVTLSTTLTAPADSVVTWAVASGAGTFTPLGADSARYAFAASDSGRVTLRVASTRAGSYALVAADGGVATTSAGIDVVAAAASSVEVVAGDGQTATVNTVVGVSPRVRVRDGYGNAVSGAVVTFRVTGGGGSVDVVAGGSVDTTGVTDGQGEVSVAEWRLGTVAGVNTLEARLGTGASVVLTATATAGAGASVTIAPASKNVTVGTTDTVEVRVEDAYGNAVSGERVDVFIHDPAGGVLSLNPADPNPTTTVTPTARFGTTDGGGRITVLYTAPSGAGEVDSVDAFTGTVGSGSVVDAVYTSVASGATDLRVSLSAASVAAGSTFVATIEAVDGNGNRDGTSAAVVSLGSSGGAMAFSLTDFGAPVTSVTLSGGVAVVYVRGTVAGSWTVDVSSAGLGGDSAPVTIRDAGEVTAYEVTVPGSVVAGSLFGVTVTARDGYGNRVTGANGTVTLAAVRASDSTQAASAVLPVTSATLSGGQVVVSETYGVSEAIRVRVSDGTVTGYSGALAVSSGAAVRVVKVTGDTTGVEAGASVALRVRVEDGLGNAVTGAGVSWSVTGGGGSVSATSSTSDGSGEAVVVLTTGSVVGTNRVAATIDDGVPASDERVEFTVGTEPGALASYEVSVTPSGLRAGETATVRVEGYDGHGNAVTNDSTTVVGLGSTTGHVVFGATSGVLSGGVYTTTLVDTVAETVAVSATSGSVTGTSAAVTVTAAPAYRVVAVRGDTTGIAVGSERELEAQVRDAWGNAVGGEVVRFVLEPPGGLDGTARLVDAVGDTTDGIVVTDGSGRARVRLVTARTAGVNTVRARILDATPDSLEVAAFSVSTVAASATSLRLSLSSANVAAGSTFVATIEAVDADGNLDPTNGATVALGATPGSGIQFSLSDFGAPITSVPLASGAVTVFVRGANAGTWTVSVSAGALSGDSASVVVRDAGVIDHYDVSTVSGATAGAIFNVSVVARDAFGNRVRGATDAVTLTAVSAADSTVPASATLLVGAASLIDGSVVVSESYPAAETIRIRAVDASAREGFSGTVAITPAGAARIVKVSGDTTGVEVGKTVTLTARVFDAFDNPGPGVTVTWNVVSGAGALSSATATSDAAGLATVQFTTDTLVAVHTVRAVIDDGNPPSSEQVDFTVSTRSAAASSVEVVAGDGQTATVNTVVGVSPRVRVRDGYGNAVSGAVVTFRVTGGGGSVDVVAGGSVDTTGVTDGQGEVSVAEWRLGTVAGVNTLEARLGTGASVVLTATATAGAGASVTIAPASKNVTVGTTDTVEVRVEDAYGNAVSGERVDVFIHDPAGGVLSLNPADPNPTTTVTPTARFGTTDGGGRITVLYTAPSGAGEVDSVDAFTGTVGSGSVVDAVYTSVASGATDLRVSLSAASVAAGSTFVATIEAVDGNGNRDGTSAAVVSLGSSGGAMAFSLTDFGAPVTSVTLSGGVAVVYVRGTVAGSWTVDVSSAGLGGDSAPVTIRDAGEVTAYEVTVPGSVVAGSLFGVTVTARDGYGNRVTGANGTVTLAAVRASDSTQAASAVLPVTSATLSGGQVVVSETYGVSEAIRVRVSDGTVTGYSGALAVSSGAAVRVVKVTGDTTGVEAGASVALRVRVEDGLGNAVTGAGVSWSVTGGGGSVSATSSTSDGSGEAVVVLTTGSVVGTNRVAATIDDGVPASDERVEFTVGTEPGALASYEVSVTPSGLRAGETATVRVEGYDGHGNAVTNDSTTVVGLGSTTGHVVFGATSGVLSGGVYTTTLVDTVAETVAVSATSGSVTGTSAAVTVTAAPAYRVVAVRGDTTGIAVGSERELEAQVRDAWGNAVGGEVVRFVLEPPGGLDGTARLVDAVGDTTDGIVVTDGSGRARVRLVTARTAGVNTVRARILDATPDSLEVAAFSVSTVAGAIDHYDVVAAPAAIVAGDSVAVSITARDADGNLVADTGTSVNVRLDPPTAGVTWSASPVTLTNGLGATIATITSAGTYTVRVETSGVPAQSGASSAVTVAPAAPAGTITASVSRDTITADGLQTSDVTTAPLTDAWGNVVAAGTPVTVTPSLGGVANADLDAAPGVQVLTDASGVARATIRAATTPGTSTVSLASVSGTATGSVPIVFAPPPAIVCDSPPSPVEVVVGTSVAFTVPVRNTSATSVTLGTGTTLRFTDGTHAYAASLDTATVVGAGATVTLGFVPALLDPLMVPAAYQPVIDLTGIDAWGAPLTATCLLPANSVRVEAVRIVGLAVPPVLVRGRTDTVRVTISNPGTQAATIDNVALTFRPGVATWIVDASSDLPMNVPAGTSRTARVLLTAAPFSVLGTDTVDASIAGTVAGLAVADPTAAPLVLPTVRVVSDAVLSYVAGSLVPATLSRGGTYALRTDLRNTGGATINVDTAATTLSFGDGLRTVVAHPAGAVAIGAGATQTILWATRTIPTGLVDSTYDVSIHVSGSESGAAFDTTLSTLAAGDPVIVQAPAVVVEGAPDAVSPDRVSLGATVTFDVRVVNAGGATVSLDPLLTRLRLAGGVYDVGLEPGGPTSIPPGTTTLRFAPRAMTVPTGTYAPTLHLEGTSNALAFVSDLTTADTVVVENAPDLAIESIATSQPAMTADQGAPIVVRMAVRNNGQADVAFTSAGLRFIAAGVDRSAQFDVGTPTAFDGGSVLAGGAADTVTFVVTDDTTGAMVTGTFTIEGTLDAVDLNTSQAVHATTDTGGRGSLVVQSPAQLDVLTVIPASPTATRSATMSPPLAVRVVVRNAGESAVDVRTISPTSLAFAPAAGWAWSGPVFAGGDTVLAGGETDTLRFDVTRIGDVDAVTTVDATVAGVERNSGRSVTAASTGVTSGTITVQTPPSIQLVRAGASRATITSGDPTPWRFTVVVRNAGEADAVFDPSSAFMAFEAVSAPPAYTPPAGFEGGGVVLAGGAVDSLVFDVAGAGTWTLTGPRTVVASTPWQDVNTGSGGLLAGVGTVRVQTLPAPLYVSGTLAPDTVSLGTTVALTADVANPDPDAAAIVLDASTTLRIATASFSAALAPTSPVTIAGGDTVTLRFDSQPVPGSLPTGPQSGVRIELAYTENDRARADTLAVPPADLVVQDAPQLVIRSIRPERTTVSVGQAPWTIVMTLENTGQADVDLDLAATALSFVHAATAADVSLEYRLAPPTALAGRGTTRLPGLATDSLVWTVDTTGVTTGTIVVDGVVTGTDVNSGQLVRDDTFDGGSAALRLQAPAAVRVRGVRVSQTSATAGQTRPWQVRVAVENAGEADAAVDLSAAGTAVTFAPAIGWVASTRPQMAGGDTLLSGGSVDTVIVDVVRTGDVPGPATIGARVSARDGNTGAITADSTSSGATVLVQAPASLAVTSVVPSRATITENTTVPWHIDATVTNAGGSDVVVRFPSALSVSIQGDGGTSTFAPVTGFVGGDSLLAAGTSATLRIDVTSTGAFTAHGVRPIDVTLSAVERNSGRTVGPAQAQGSIVVQTGPSPDIVAGTLDPDTVSIGAVVGFAVTVRNADPDAATVHLDRATTRLRAAGGYSAPLDPASADSIPGGGQAVLRFEPRQVPPATPPGAYDLALDLAWQANGVAGAITRTDPAALTVQSAPQLDVAQIVTSQPRATAGQTTPWSVQMTVRNNGGAIIDIDTSRAGTGITFALPGVGVDSSAAVTLVSWPDSLAGGESGVLTFTVTRTGDSTGVVTIDGRVRGRDRNTGQFVTGDTFAGGRGSVVVQSPSRVRVARVVPSRSPVTTGQGGWQVRVVVANDGESDFRVDLSRAAIDFGADTPAWSVGAPVLAGGADVLEGGAVDSLVFPVLTTGSPGLRRVDAVVRGQEINSARPDSADTGGGGWGTIDVRTPPVIDVVATTADAPRDTFVNAGQAFAVGVRVHNAGGADAEDVRVRLVSRHGATVMPAEVDVVALAAGDTADVAFGVTAPAIIGPDTLVARVVSARDANSQAPVTALAGTDTVAVVVVQAPSVLAVGPVQPSDSTVTRGQTVPWSVTVRVANSGGAPLVLDPPAPDDLAFRVGGARAPDYVVQPPPGFASGAPGWTLGPGVVDSLVYAVIVTGSDTGRVDVEATLTAVDANDAAARTATASAPVHVQAPAGLFIRSTVVRGVVRGVGNRAVVDTRQSFFVDVSVENTGETVDSVTVILSSDSASTIDASAAVPRSIGPDAVEVYTFSVVADSLPNALETFRAAIVRALSRNTGLPVVPQPPIDDVALVQIQRPAAVEVDLAIVAPPGAVNGSVSPSQTFVLAGVVRNAGEAPLDASASRLRLVLPPGFASAEATDRTYAPGDTVTWTVTAAPSPGGPFDVAAGVSPLPIDVNTAAPAAVVRDTARVAVTVSPGGALAAPALAVVSPSGARDDTVSTGQTFTVELAVTPSPDARTVRASLAVPSGWVVLGATQVVLGDGDGTRRSDTLRVVAPALSADATLRADFTAVDANSGDTLRASASVGVSVVSRASLAVSASVADNTVAPAEPFDVTALVNNAGTAGVTGPGELEIDLPTGYALVAGASPVAAFAPGTPVTWTVTAPTTPSGPDVITVRIRTVPRDENSGLPARVTSAASQVAMVTEGAAVSVGDVTAAEGIDTRVVPGGERDVALLAVSLRYVASDTAAPDARIDTLALTVLGSDGRPLAPSVVRRTLERVRVEIDGRAWGVAPTDNPVAVPITGTALQRRIAPGRSTTARVLVDVAREAAAAEIRLALGAGGVVVSDAASGARLGVLDEASGDALTRVLRSGSLVILEGRFDQYVHNYPNPFRAGRDVTRIAYVLDRPSEVTVRIYTLTGALVWETTIRAGDPGATAGAHEVEWDGRNMRGVVVRNGLYVCQVSAGGRSARFRIAVAR